MPLLSRLFVTNCSATWANLPAWRRTSSSLLW